MSSSSRSRIADPRIADPRSAARRRLLRVCAALLPAAGLAPPPRSASAALPPPGRDAVAAAVADPTAGLTRWGRGEFRRFGILVYEATLWALDDPERPPLALRLDYRRSIPGRSIAEASVGEMRRLGVDETSLQVWGGRMAALFPNLEPGDHLLGLHRPDGARFFHNARALGEIADAGFARSFFAIWLDPRTSAPALRDALLRRAQR